MVKCAKVPWRLAEEIVVEQLYPERLEILSLLARQAGSGRTPSIREIADIVGLRSSQTVHHYLIRLEEDGYIERLDDQPHTPRFTVKGWEVVCLTPLLGRIAAGRGLEAAVLGEEAYPLAAELHFSCSGRRRYLLRVVGQSMTGAGVEDEDLLVVEKYESPPDGVVVALLNSREEVMVKRLCKDGYKVSLEPENDEHEDIVISADSVRA